MWSAKVMRGVNDGQVMMNPSFGWLEARLEGRHLICVD